MASPAPAARPREARRRTRPPRAGAAAAARAARAARPPRPDIRRLRLVVGPEDEGERLDRFLAHRGGISRMEARRALDRGGVYLDGKRCKVASRPLRPGQRVEAALEESGRVQEATVPDLEVLFEDEQLLAVNKPAGVPSQAALTGDVGTLPWLVGRHLGVPASAVATVHRLDRETSGVVVFGKSRGATRLLAQAFREGTVHKEYVAVVAGRLEAEGRLDAPLGPSPGRRGSFAVVPGGLPAVTGYRPFGWLDELASGVRLVPETGRTHQLRVHLAHLGHPILGDVRYGGPRTAGALAASRTLLHAEVLEVPHPGGGRRRLVAPRPADLVNALALLA